MALILNIDTALERSSICIAEDERSLDWAQQTGTPDNGEWPHQVLKELLRKNHLSLKQLDAIAVTIGPGSYTGLRVGLAAAKGLCYALQKPLIAVGTLEVMAHAVREEAVALICPMIDARRMEVFMAVYTKEGEEKIKPRAMILDDTSFSDWDTTPVLFCGTGSTKLEMLPPLPFASISTTTSNATHLASLSATYFRNKEFSNLAYAEPLYIKEFYGGPRKVQ